MSPSEFLQLGAEPMGFAWAFLLQTSLLRNVVPSKGLLGLCWGTAIRQENDLRRTTQHPSNFKAFCPNYALFHRGTSFASVSGTLHGPWIGHPLPGGDSTSGSVDLVYFT